MDAKEARKALEELFKPEKQNNNNPYLKDILKIKIITMNGKDVFDQEVLVDRDLEIQRKLNIAIIKLLSDNKKTANLVLHRVGSNICSKTTGYSASLPAYLFGKEYFKARRIDPNNLWDLRKEAFIPVVSKNKK